MVVICLLFCWPYALSWLSEVVKGMVGYCREEELRLRFVHDGLQWKP